MQYEQINLPDSCRTASFIANNKDILQQWLVAIFGIAQWIQFRTKLEKQRAKNKEAACEEWKKAFYV